MAGIGFLLRKLAAQENLSGVLRAYFHSAVVAAGPWLMVVIALFCIITSVAQSLGIREADEFLSIILYNFFFSFILSSPLYMVSARYVADCLYLRRLSPIPGIMITTLFFLLIPIVFLGIVFYAFYATMPPFETILSVINFSLLSEIWILMLYLGCVRNFRAITRSWILGIVLVIALAIYWGKMYGATGMLMGFNVGIIFILFSMKAHVLVEYDYPFRRAKEFGFYFKNYKGLFWSGFLLFGGMWIDKVLMWFAPEATLHLNNLKTYPIYDGAMLFSYLTIIPVLALFIFSLETNFYDSYIKYIQHIERNAPLALIEEEKQNIFAKIVENGRSFLVLQGSISLIFIVFAPTFFNWIGVDFLQLNIFRLGTLGAFFGSLNLCIVIIFSYFDSQNNMMIVTSTMFLSVIALTLLTLHLGFAFYGYGYCLSMILTFFIAGTRLVHFLNRLTFHIFITNIVKRRSLTDKGSEPISVS
jgi:uncharacterized membrane protein